MFLNRSEVISEHFYEVPLSLAVDPRYIEKTLDKYSNTYATTVVCLIDYCLKNQRRKHLESSRSQNY